MQHEVDSYARPRTELDSEGIYARRSSGAQTSSSAGKGEKVILDIRKLGPRLDHVKRDTATMRATLLRGKSRTPEPQEDEDDDEDELWTTKVSPVVARALTNFANRVENRTPGQASPGARPNYSSPGPKPSLLPGSTRARQTPPLSNAGTPSTPAQRPWIQIERPGPENRIDITPNPLYNEEFDDSPQSSPTASPPESLLQRLSSEAARSIENSSGSGGSADFSELFDEEEEGSESDNSDSYESPTDVHVPSHRRTLSIDLDNAADGKLGGAPAAGCSITLPQNTKPATKQAYDTEMPQLQLDVAPQIAEAGAASEPAVSPASSVQVIESPSPAAEGPAKPWQAPGYKFPELVPKPFTFKQSSTSGVHGSSVPVAAAAVPVQEVSPSPSGCTGSSMTSSPDRAVYQEGVDSPNTAVKKQIAAIPWLDKVREFISSPSVSDETAPQPSSGYVKSRLSPRESVDSATPVPTRLAPGVVSAEVPVAFGSPLTMSDHKSRPEQTAATPSSWQIPAEYAKGTDRPVIMTEAELSPTKASAPAKDALLSNKSTPKSTTKGKTFLVASVLAITVLLGSSAIITSACGPLPVTTCLASATGEAATSTAAFSADATAALYNRGVNVWHTVLGDSSRKGDAAWDSTGPHSHAPEGILGRAISLSRWLLGYHTPEEITDMEPATCIGHAGCLSPEDTGAAKPYAEWYLAARAKAHNALQCLPEELGSWLCACKNFSLRALHVVERMLQLAGNQITSATADSVKASSIAQYGQAMAQPASWVPMLTTRTSALEAPDTPLSEGKVAGVKGAQQEPPEEPPAVHDLVPPPSQAETAASRPTVTEVKETKEAAATGEPPSARSPPRADDSAPMPDLVAASESSTSSHSADVEEAKQGPAEQSVQQEQNPAELATRASWTNSSWAWHFLLPTLGAFAVLSLLGTACHLLLSRSTALFQDEDSDAISAGIHDSSPPASEGHHESPLQSAASSPAASPARSMSVISTIVRASTPSAILRAVTSKKQEGDASEEEGDEVYSTPVTTKPLTRRTRRSSLAPKSAAPAAAALADAVSTSTVRTGRSLRSTADAPTSVSRTTRRMTRARAAVG